MTTNPPPPPWTAVSVVEKSYALARDNFAAFFPAILILGAPGLIANALGLGLLGRIVELACSVATAICITCATLQAMAGHKPTMESILKQLQRPNIGPLLGLGAIQYVVITISAILVIPPFFLLPLWAVTIPAMLIERTDIAASFWRSVDLTRDRRLPILGAFVLWFVIFIVAAVVIFFLIGHGGILQHLVIWLFGAAAATVIQPLPAIFYVLLRGEKEGATLEQITAALD
jgi:hypothetical protein